MNDDVNLQEEAQKQLLQVAIPGAYVRTRSGTREGELDD